MSSDDLEDFRVLTKTQDSLRRYRQAALMAYVLLRRTNLSKLIESNDPENEKTQRTIEQLGLLRRLDEMESCIDDNQFFLDQVADMHSAYIADTREGLEVQLGINGKDNGRHGDEQTVQSVELDVSAPDEPLGASEEVNVHIKKEDQPPTMEEQALALEASMNIPPHSASPPLIEAGYADANDHSKIRASLRQLVREWSADGAQERAQSYGLVLNELLELYPDLQTRHKTKVLVPGCGLGRLPFDLCYHGFQAQGNEYSYHMLFISRFIINGTTQRNEYRIRPFIHSFSHNRSKSQWLREVLIPDVNPRVLVDQQQQDPGIPSDGLMSMAAGSFDEIYPPKDCADDLFDVVTTVFFIDTSPNVVKTIQVIHDTLQKGGYWINFGPLLWHQEDDAESNGLELCMDDLVQVVIPQLGFKIIKHSSGHMCRYSSDPTNASGYYYECDLWVAQKI